jgi:hypothetical protein
MADWRVLGHVLIGRSLRLLIVGLIIFEAYFIIEVDSCMQEQSEY